MTTKNKEFTNEDVARELGWEAKLFGWKDAYWLLPNGEKFYETDKRAKYYRYYDIDSLYTPDFQNDNNAAIKYVWPELKKLMIGEPYSYIAKMFVTAFDSKNPTLYLTNTFMEMKGWKI